MLGMSMTLNDTVLSRPYPPNSIKRSRRRRSCKASSSSVSGAIKETSSTVLPRKRKLKLFTSLTSLRQRSCGLYDCMLEHCDNEHKQVTRWLLRCKARNRSDLDYQNRLAAFERHIKILKNEGVNYNPRDRNAPIPLNTRQARLALDARAAWRGLRTEEDRITGFDRILEEAADLRRRGLDSLKAKLEIAHGRHILHMSPRLSKRKAVERWIRAGKLTIYGQWIMRALGTPTPPPAK